MTESASHNIYITVLLIMLLYLPATFAAGNLLSEGTYKKLSNIHELVGKEQYKAAMQKLDALLPQIRNNRYETVLAYQTYGYIYALQGRHQQAISHYNKCLEYPGLEPQLAGKIRYSLGQLYILDGQYRKGIDILVPLLKQAGNDTASVMALVASAYIEMKQYQLAAEYLRQALATVARPPENWQQMLVSCYYELKQYNKAAPILKTLIELHPDKYQYWNQLSSVYYKTGQLQQSLATMALASRNGLLKTAVQWKTLINLYLYNNIPVRAAELLDEGIKNRIFSADEKHWTLLGDIWLMAREIDKALEAYRNASAISMNSEIDFKRAGILMSEQRWQDVVQLTGEIIGGKPDTQRISRAYWLQGIAYYESKRYQQALKAFRKVDSGSGYAAESRQWIDQINTVVSLRE